MFTSVLGAVAIADIIVFVVLGLGLVLGLIGGLAKAFKGLFATLSIILISLLLVGVSVGPISSSLGGSLSGTLENSAKGWGEAFSSPVYISEANGQPVMDGDHFAYCVELNGELVSLESAAGSGVLGKIKGKLAVGLAQHYITSQDKDGVSLAGYAADALTKIIFDVALFIVYCIVLGVVFYLLRKVFKKMHDAESSGVRLLDRVLGGVVAAGLALLALLLVFAIIKLAAPAGSKVAQFFESAKIAGTLYNINPMGKVFTKLF